MRRLEDLTDDWAVELFSPHPDEMNSSNNCSLVAKFIPKREGFRYLVTGDTETVRWEKIESIFKDKLRSDVMSAPHHGSKSAVHVPSLRRIRPDHILVSAGVDNPFKHPHDEALSAYRELSARTFSTHLGKSYRTYESFFWGVRTVEWTASQEQT